MPKTAWNLPGEYDDAQAIQGGEVTTTAGTTGQTLTVTSASPYTIGWSTPISYTDPVSGTISFTSDPWTVNQTGNYKLQVIGNQVVLWMQDVTAACNNTVPIITEVFIPSALRPAVSTVDTIIGTNHSAQIVLLVSVRNTGDLYISLTTGAGFTAIGNCGYRSFTAVWMI